VELTPELLSRFDRPIHLVVADGNWSQARKVASREPVLEDVPRVRLAAGRRSAYQLRQSPHPENLATFEAIARALGVSEGAGGQGRLEELFEILVERTLWSRGLLPLKDCRHSIPEAAVESFFVAGRAGDPVKTAKS